MEHSKLLTAMMLAVALWQPAFSANGGSAPPVHRRYVAIDLGNSRSRGGLSGFESTESSTGFALRFGYQLNRYFAVEAGYADFGDFDFEYRPGTCPGRPAGGCDITTSSSLHGPLASVVGLIPLNDRWALKARAGVFHVTVSSKESGPGAPTSPPANSTDSNGGLQFGAAVTYSFSDRMEVEIGWNQFEQLGLGLNLGGFATVFSGGSSSLTSIGLAYRF